MQNIQDFIGQVAGQLGVQEDSARTATSGLLGLIAKQADSGDADRFIAGLPGAGALLAPPEGGSKSGGGGLGGMLGGLAGQAGDLLGGKMGSALGVLGLLKQSGLSGDQAGSLVVQFFQFAQTKVGQDLVGRILGQIPELKKMLG